MTRSTEPLIFEKSIPGVHGLDLPDVGVPERPISDLLLDVALRVTPPALPEVSEPQVVRHYTRLSQLNHAVDTGFYPLGSCTMKYNPKMNDELAGLPGFASLHPYQPEEDAQGVLELMWNLEQSLLEITGLSRVSFQPSAGAQGELVGILMIRAYHREHDASDRRTIVLVPDSAHGTNLATAALAGYRVVELPSSPRGLVDPLALKAALSDEVAALMLTNPNTLGLFEEDILEITSMMHEAGGLVYYDGANLNAIMGKARPGDMGMDVVHMNLHKTFSTPHGGGGPGAGPVAVGERLEPYLPAPLVARRPGAWTAEAGRGTARESGSRGGGESDDAGFFYLDYDRPRSIGRVKGFYGNVGVLIRAYAYILRMGGDGLRQASEDAVLAANYLRARLAPTYEVPFNRPCMHEFVASASRQRTLGVRALDIGKRLLDFGIHAPTVYFPLIVPEALMIEPTESEDKETLDSFVDAMLEIDRESRETPEVLLEAPRLTPVRRPDEVAAARRPVLRWEPPRAT